MSDLSDRACACLQAADSLGGLARYRYGWATRPRQPSYPPGMIDALTRRGLLVISCQGHRHMRANTTQAGRDALKSRQAESAATWASIARRQTGERDDDAA